MLSTEVAEGFGAVQVTSRHQGISLAEVDNTIVGILGNSSKPNQPVKFAVFNDAGRP